MSDLMFTLLILCLSTITHTIVYRLGKAAGRVEECRHRTNRIDLGRKFTDPK